ncbi:hypothetical protein NPIL_416401 [Nephila pilipes]|uniref:Uncharacterized protein n=1 Tax=Nephila pilipes TaxID=299642 RepID=A0A8X6IUT1_NEPPI|nr:hypothetical protein NPIL_416401 [Nephila pilipes]
MGDQLVVSLLSISTIMHLSGTLFALVSCAVVRPSRHPWEKDPQSHYGFGSCAELDLPAYTNGDELNSRHPTRTSNAGLAKMPLDPSRSQLWISHAHVYEEMGQPVVSTTDAIPLLHHRGTLSALFRMGFRPLDHLVRAGSHHHIGRDVRQR